MCERNCAGKKTHHTRLEPRLESLELESLMTYVVLSPLQPKTGEYCPAVWPKKHSDALVRKAVIHGVNNTILEGCTHTFSHLLLSLFSGVLTPTA